MTRLGKGLERAWKRSGAPTLADFCSAAGVSYHWMRSHIGRMDEPLWLRILRAVKRASGMTWDEILGEW